MLRTLAIACGLALMTQVAMASTECTTRKSGSVNITSCSGKSGSTTCRSYKSGSVTKTYCS